MTELLILVDEQDNEIGFMDKLTVHQLGKLHRAFSIFIFNSKGELLLQQRADSKYHSPGLWSNTCCSHPRPGEKTGDAVNRRLMEELGLTCNLQHDFSFIYKTNFSNGLTEHEFDHVYTGITNDIPRPNADEVKDWKYISLPELQKGMTENSANYTEWLKICLPEILVRFNQKNNKGASI